MWRLMKLIFFGLLIIFIVLAVTGYKIGGRTVTEHLKQFLSQSDTKEGIKDIRQMVGEAIKSVGEEISDDVSDKEREELEKLVRDELKKAKDLGESNREISASDNKNKVEEKKSQKAQEKF